MPSYTYQCGECGFEFEKFQSMTSPVQKKCPDCGKLKLVRLIGAGAGVIFKGSGFYATDYGRSKDYEMKKSAKGDLKKGPAEKKTKKE